MRLIGYFKQRLGYYKEFIVAEIQEIAARCVGRGGRQFFEIQATSAHGSEIRVYHIRMANDRGDNSSTVFSTQEEANAFLEKLILTPSQQVIDLRNYDNLYCEYSDSITDVYVKNPIDIFTEEEYPLVVRLASEDE